MFKKITPESVGIQSKVLYQYLSFLNEKGLYMHSVLIAKGNGLFCEAYWSPYSADESQRMYSITKSFVGIAICQLVTEGRLSFDDKIVDYFQDKLTKPIHPYLEAQTVRHMLIMQTCMTDNNWFDQGVKDRLLHYFEHKPSHYPGTGFYYDSSASFVLGALVERITGLSLLDYLRAVALDKIGFSENARCLKVPGGHSWADSGLLCTSMDMLKVGRLIANGGKWNGKQLLNPKAVKTALQIESDTFEFGIYDYASRGYGSFIWHSYDGSIMFCGMHGQFMIYHPKTDIIFVCTAGNPSSSASELIISGFLEMVVNSLQTKLQENVLEYNLLQQYIKNLEIPTAQGKQQSVYEKEINGKVFIAKENEMGIHDFRLQFYDNYCSFTYHNQQGKKTIKAGRQRNIIQQFPEYGYSKEYGSEKTQNHTYRCAASFAWVEKTKLNMIIQIIDEYLGLLFISIGYNENHAWLQMHKEGEDFLNEYHGRADASRILDE